MKVKIETSVCKSISYFSVSVDDDGNVDSYNFENESSALSFLHSVVENFLSNSSKRGDTIIYQNMFPLVCGYRAQIVYRYNGIQPLREFNVVMRKEFLDLL